MLTFTGQALRGELLSAGTFFVGTLKGVGKVWLHAVVDTYGSYAFGLPRTSRNSPKRRWRCCMGDVLPFYRHLDLPVKAVLTDNGREFCGTENHPYELYLDLNDIEHRRTKVRSPRTNGLKERVGGTVLDEFFRVKMRETCLTRPSRRCRPTSMPGSSTTTPSARVRVIATRAGGPWKP